jgi:hypothetical protein
MAIKVSNTTVVDDNRHFIAKSYRSDLVSGGTTSSSQAIDCSTGGYFAYTVSSNTTFSFSSVPASGTVYSAILEINHTGGTITWPAAVKWPDNTAPTLTTGKYHLFVFITDDGGTTWRGASLINYAA